MVRIGLRLLGSTRMPMFRGASTAVVSLSGGSFPHEKRAAARKRQRRKRLRKRTAQSSIPGESADFQWTLQALLKHNKRCLNLRIVETVI